MQAIAGIDPGLDGGLALIVGGKVALITTTPTFTTRTSTGKNKRIYDTKAMRSFIQAAKDQGAVAIIERVHAFPGQGVTSMFSMGYGYGLWEGIMIALGVSFQRVEPATWKRQMGLNKDKERSRALAIQLYPDIADKLQLKKSEGSAEALLLADWGRRHGMGQTDQKTEGGTQA